MSLRRTKSRYRDRDMVQRDGTINLSSMFWLALRSSRVCDSVYDADLYTTNKQMKKPESQTVPV